jgi:hypothetical protein
MPSDLNNALGCVDDAVNELNLSWGRPNNKHIELVHWSTHVSPGASVGSIQNLINKELGTNFDLYIGILWKRFGTPTDNAESGTEEEFNLAYERFLQNPAASQILFYFCDTPFTLDEIDLKQLQKVQDFKQRLKDNNILFGSYADFKELSKLLRLHIPARLDSLTAIIPTEITNIEVEAKESVMEGVIQEINEEDFAEDDRGLLEYREEFDSYLKVSLSSIGQITRAMTTIGTRTQTKTKQLTTLQANPHTSISQYRSLLRGMAKYMDDYTNKLEVESNIYAPAFDSAMNAALQLLNLSSIEKDSMEELRTQRQSVYELYGTMDGSIQSSVSFLQSIQSLPKLTTELNKARNRMILTQQSFIEKLNRSKDLVQEVIDAHDRKIENIQLA